MLEIFRLRGLLKDAVGVMDAVLLELLEEEV